MRHESVNTREVAAELDAFPADQPSVGAFRDVYETALPQLVRLAHLITGSNSAAEDIVHDVFVSAYRRWKTIDDPHGYLYRAVVNRSRSVLRRRSTELKYAAAVEPSGDLPPELDEVWLALSRLPAKRRAVLVLRFYEDLQVDAIAEILGVREATVRSLIHRGYISMRKELNYE